MKKIILFLVVMFFLANSAYANNNFHILNAVYLDGPKFFDFIPTGHEANYGFQENTEFIDLIFGEPIQAVGVDMEKGSLEKYSEWKVPIIENNYLVAFFNVAKKDDSFRVVSIGSNFSAKKLQPVYDNFNIVGYMFMGGDDFAMIDDNKFIPIAYMPETNDNLTKSSFQKVYTLEDVVNYLNENKGN